MASRVSRPVVHFTAKTGWINDPHGLTVKDGRYHLFFQHVPDSMEWGADCRWGHAVSEDLTSWEAQPIALAPGDGDHGIWSGSVTVDQHREAVLYYTSVRTPDFGIGRVRVARPAASTWVEWDKGEVVVDLPKELDAIAFRDPYVFRDDSRWRMLVGTSLRDGTAAAASFSSTDRIRWEYDGLAAQRSGEQVEPVWTGTLWECPQIFEVDGAHVLVTSVWDDDVLYYVAYAVGEYADGRFVAHQWNRLTFGDSYYAPSFFRDREGRPCLIFWLRGAADEQAGWAGAHSAPHLLSFVRGRLVTQLHPDVRKRVSTLAQTDEGRGLELLGWEPHRGEARIIDSSPGTRATLRKHEAGIEVIEGEDRLILPGIADQLVVLLLDGPVLEVFFGSSCYAIGARSDLTVRAPAEAMKDLLRRESSVPGNHDGIGSCPTAPPHGIL